MDLLFQGFFVNGSAWDLSVAMKYSYAAALCNASLQAWIKNGPTRTTPTPGYAKETGGAGFSRACISKRIDKKPQSPYEN
jgi:hypothetical protein